MLPLCVDSSVHRYIVAVMQGSTEAAFPTFGYSKIQSLVEDQYCSQRMQQSLIIIPLYYPDDKKRSVRIYLLWAGLKMYLTIYGGHEN